MPQAIFARAMARDLRARVPGGASVAGDVAAIVADVRERGDDAVREYAERFDGLARGASLEGARDELGAALAGLDGDVRAGLEVAIANVGAVARAGLSADVAVELPQGQ